MIRIIIECELDVDLKAIIETAVAAQTAAPSGEADLAGDLYSFVTDRLRHYFLEADTQLATETFDAVLARQPASLVDFGRRLHAVQDFIELEPASSLAAANKRIANILRQAEFEGPAPVQDKLLTEPAEKALKSALESASAAVTPMIDKREYTRALAALAELRGPVDQFFDDVMVMAEDDATRGNRLALLSELRALFLDVADISRLAI